MANETTRLTLDVIVDDKGGPVLARLGNKARGAGKEMEGMGGKAHALGGKLGGLAGTVVGLVAQFSPLIVGLNKALSLEDGVNRMQAQLG